MPWFIAVLLGVAALGLVVKAVLDRKARYDEPTNDWDGRFDHMMEPGSERDKQLHDRTR